MLGPNAERRPRRRDGAPKIDRANGDRSTVRAAAHIPPPRRPDRRVQPERELIAWALAVKHLHSAGLPAAVPPFAARWLRRRGIRADWETAA